jgi:phage virion morphogenesis protein
VISVEFDTKAIAERLSRLGDAIGDMTPVHKDIGEYMVKATRERFLRGEAPDGTKWRPKSHTTLARYLAQGDGSRPDPLIGPSRRLSREVLSFATKDGVEIGSALEYAGVMQFGAAQGAFGKDSRNHPLPWGDIPARVWLGLSEDDERNILDIAETFLEAAVGEQNG